jgi:dTDP-4-amino-4,6-dideoxygalactose transaminase
MTNSSATASTKVPFLDLGAAYRELKPEIDAAVARVIAGGWYILGPEVEAFEREFADFCGAAACAGTSNGLDALHLVLRAWDIGPGDEVIVPAHTFIATWLAVSYCGATVVPVDADPRTYNLDPSLLEAAITPRTKAIIAVHLYGQPADIDPIVAVARRHGIRVLEDAAQAQGAVYRGRRAGSLADAAAWSFYPGKNLGALGDGGAVTSNDRALVERVRVLANYGSRAKYVHDERGFNCRLDELQAAILRAKLPHLDDWNRRRVAAAARYATLLRDCDVTLPYVPDEIEPVWHLYVVRSRRRDALRAELEASGIGTIIHYPVPPYRQAAYAELNIDPARFPVADALAREVLSLPMGPHLTAEQQERVADALRESAG